MGIFQYLWIYQKPRVLSSPIGPVTGAIMGRVYYLAVDVIACERVRYVVWRNEN